MPNAQQVAAVARRFADSMLFTYPRSGHALARDFKWLGSWRYGIIHLDGRDEQQLRERCLQTSKMLGWRAPYADQLTESQVQPAWQSPPLSVHGD